MEIKPILSSYIPIAEMLVKTFGEDCEVVLHDLSVPEHSVIYVANNKVTDRKVGESFDELVKQVILSNNLKNNYVANYYFTAKNGKKIRSSTLLIKNSEGFLEGAMCINIDTTRINEQIEFLKSFLPEEFSENELSKNKKSSNKQEHVFDMVSSLIDNIIGNKSILQMSRNERIEKIRFMDTKGIFLMKGSIEKVAEKLGVNKVTIYSYLDEVRGKR